jgi:hypothetical protein
MKLIIQTNDWRDTVEFNIAHIEYEVDENNIPFDICIAADEDTVKSICDEYALIGCNMQELIIENYAHRPGDLAKWWGLGATHECLIARLPDFFVKEAKKVKYIG